MQPMVVLQNFTSNATVDTQIPEQLGKAIFQFAQNKYGYNLPEIIMMVIITAVTNFAIVPIIVLFHKEKMLFQNSIGSFTLLCSFTYHLLDSIGLEGFIISIDQWHRLDNIGSIISFMGLMGYLADLQDLYLETTLNYIGVFIALLAQETDPWNIDYTIYPLISWALLCVGIKIWQVQTPRLNKKKVRLGIFFLIGAIFSFYNGLDDFNDYLRFYHGMWHLNISLFCFYMWQSKLVDTDGYSLRGVWTSRRVKGNYYWPTGRMLIE